MQEVAFLWVWEMSTWKWRASLLCNLTHNLASALRRSWSPTADPVPAGGRAVPGEEWRCRRNERLITAWWEEIAECDRPLVFLWGWYNKWKGRKGREVKRWKAGMVAKEKELRKRGGAELNKVFRVWELAVWEEAEMTWKFKSNSTASSGWFKKKN